MDEDESRLEVGVAAPRSEESNCAAALELIILRVDVKETSLANRVSRRILCDGLDVENSQSGTVIALVQVSVNDVLVVVDGTALALEIAGVVGVLKVTDVEDVSSGQALSHGANLGVAFVEFVVKEEVLLPLLVVDYTLVNVLGSRVRGDRDDVGHVADLVGGIIDGQCVLVVAIADIASVVALVRATVHKALCIVNITVSSSTARRKHIGRISHVQVDKTATAGKVATNTNGLVSTHGSNSNGVVKLLVDNDVMRTPSGKLVPVAGKVVLGEVVRIGRVEVENLLHIENLDARVDGLRANDSIIAQNTDLAPSRADRVVLGKTTKVYELALARDFGKSSTVELANCYELTSILRRPSPG